MELWLEVLHVRISIIPCINQMNVELLIKIMLIICCLAKVVISLIVKREESEMLERHEKNGHVPLYDCLLKYGVLDTVQVVLKDVCDKDYEYDIESRYIVLHNERDIERLKVAVKNSKVTGRLKNELTHI